MKPEYRRMVYVAVLVGLLLVCGGLGVQATEPPKITFWMFGTEDPTTVGFLNDVTGQFRKESAITVDWKIISWDDAQNRLMLAVTSGEAPDISMVGATWVGYFMATGAILDLSPYLQRFGGAEAFIPGAWLSAGMSGNIIAPPWDADTRALVYRKDVFDKLGLALPDTWDEWVSVAKKIQEKTGQHYPVAMPSKGWSPIYNLVWLTYLNSGDVISKDGKTALLDSPKVVQAATFMADLMTKHKVMSPSVAGYGNLEVVTSFVNGECSMILAPIYYVYQAAEKPGSAVAGKWSFCLPPAARKDIPKVSMVLPDNLMIFKDTKQRDAALRFMEFLLREPQMVKYATTFGLPPTTKAAFRNPEFSSPYWKAHGDIMAVGKFVPLVPAWGEAEVSIQRAVSNIMSAAASGGATPQVIESELKKANKAFQDAINAAE